MRTIACPLCDKIYQVEYHFFGKICQCGFEIPSDGDIEIVKNNKKKNEELKQKAIDSVKRKLNYD